MENQPETTEQKRKTTFDVCPQNRGNGQWSGRESISHCYRKFMNMTRAEFEQWKKAFPESKRTHAETIALTSFKMAHDSRSDANKLAAIREITDRTEGKAKQYVEQTTTGSVVANLNLSREDLERIVFGTPAPVRNASQSVSHIRARNEALKKELDKQKRREKMKAKKEAEKAKTKQ